MRAVVQRVASAQVRVGEQVTGSIGAGLLVLVAVHESDTVKEAEWLADKIVDLRLFTDTEDKMNLSCREIGGELLVVSQFTLYGDCRRGRRPSYCHSASPDKAEPLYGLFVEQLKRSGLRVQEGIFQAHMEVSLVNDGPVTLIVESPQAVPQ